MKLKIIILVLLITTVSCKKESKKLTVDSPETEELTVYVANDGRHCFLSEIKNKTIKGKDTIIEKDYLNVNLIIDSNNVTGQYSFTPTSGEANKGDFVGTIKDNVITSIYTYTQKGKESKEEIIFKVERNQISLLGGEKIEREGTFYFKDKTKGIYMIQIPKINCN